VLVLFLNGCKEKVKKETKKRDRKKKCLFDWLEKITRVLKKKKKKKKNKSIFT